MRASDTIAVTSIAPWVGANAGMTRQIIAELGPHTSYWEIFLGGGSVLLAKTAAQKETVSDLHPELCNLVAVLASDRWFVLNSRADRTVYDERLLGWACEYLEQNPVVEAAVPNAVSQDQLEQAYATFVKWWMGRGGTAGGPTEGKASLRFNSSGGSMPSRYRSACASIEGLHYRLERVGIYHRDAFALLPKIEDKAGTVIYADPTFIGKDRLYDFALDSRPDGAALMTDDHDRLAELLNRFKKTRVVLRYYRHDRLASLYLEDKWRLVDCTRVKQSASPTKIDRSVWSDDILLVNGPPTLASAT